jgi:lipopolysaccharide transport system ATP-binding protein
VSAPIVLSCSGVGKVYRSSPGEEMDALVDIDLEVAAGTALTVVGANGAGKSTLLKVIAGITSPTRGRVERTSRTVSLIELGAGFGPELTGRENIDLSLSLAGFGPRERALRAPGVLDTADIGDAVDTPVKRYSDGMRARLAVGVALASSPELLLIDEVLAVGDSAFQREAMSRARDCVAQGAALLLVTHDMQLARLAAPSSIWIDRGRVVASGPSERVVSQYMVTRFGAVYAPGEVHTRVERVVLAPRRIRPGDPVQVTATLHRTAEARPCRVRIDLRPPAGPDHTWMREVDEPPELRAWNLIASSESHDISSLGPGDHVLHVELPRISITPPGIEVVVTVVEHDSERIVDEAGATLHIDGEPTNRKLWLDVTTRTVAGPTGGGPPPA